MKKPNWRFRLSRWWYLREYRKLHKVNSQAALGLWRQNVITFERQQELLEQAGIYSRHKEHLLPDKASVPFPYESSHKETK